MNAAVGGVDHRVGQALRRWRPVAFGIRMETLQVAVVDAHQIVQAGLQGAAGLAGGDDERTLPARNPAAEVAVAEAAVAVRSLPDEA